MVLRYDYWPFTVHSDRVRQENLAVVPSSGVSCSCVTWKVGCGLPSGGEVSAVWYAFDVWGNLLHLLPHAAIAASLVASFWLFMV